MAATWKYKLEITDEQSVMLPNGAQVLSVAVLYNELFLYALGEPSERPEDTCVVRIYGTGHPVEGGVPDPFTRLPESERRTFLGTCVTHGGQLVWHVFYTMQRKVPTTVFGQTEPYYLTSRVRGTVT